MPYMTLTNIVQRRESSGQLDTTEQARKVIDTGSPTMMCNSGGICALECDNRIIMVLARVKKMIELHHAIRALIISVYMVMTLEVPHFVQVFNPIQANFYCSCIQKPQSQWSCMYICHQPNPCSGKDIYNRFS